MMRITLEYYEATSLECMVTGQGYKTPAGWQLELHCGIYFGTIEFAKRPSKNVLRKAKRQLIKEYREDIEHGFFLVS